MKRVIRERDALVLCRRAVEAVQAFRACGQQPTLDPGGSGEYRKTRRNMERALAAAEAALALAPLDEAREALKKQDAMDDGAPSDPVLTGEPGTPEWWRSPGFMIHGPADTILRLLEQEEISRRKALELLAYLHVGCPQDLNRALPPAPWGKLNWCDDRPDITAREACRRRMKLDGADVVAAAVLAAKESWAGALPAHDSLTCPFACPHGDQCALESGHDGGHNHRGCDCNEPDQPPCDRCGERKPVETITGPCPICRSRHGSKVAHDKRTERG